MYHDHQPTTNIAADGSVSEIDTRVVDGDDTLTGVLNTSVCVHEGTFTIARGANLNGSLHVQAGARVEIFGAHNGSLHVASDAVTTVSGQQNGSVHVAEAGLVEVTRTGHLAGTLHNAGRIVNKGIRGGTVSDVGGTIDDVDGGTVKAGTVRGDTTTYTW